MHLPSFPWQGLSTSETNCKFGLLSCEGSSPDHSADDQLDDPVMDENVAVEICSKNILYDLPIDSERF